jgi:uncharacterized RmlC-like cupin family protein
MAFATSRASPLLLDINRNHSVIISTSRLVPFFYRAKIQEEHTVSWRAGDNLIAPRNIPHQLRNSGNVPNHYLIMFSPAGFEEFLKATSVPAPDNAVAPQEPPTIAVQNVFELAAEYGIQFE